MTVMSGYFEQLLNDILRSAEGLNVNERIAALRRQRQKHERKCYAQGQHMQRLIDNGVRERAEYEGIAALRMERKEFLERYHKLFAELAFATRSAMQQSVIEDLDMELQGLRLSQRIFLLERHKFEGLVDIEEILFAKHKFMSHLIEENGGDRTRVTSHMRRALADISDLQHHKEMYGYQIGLRLEEARRRQLGLRIFSQIRVFSADIEDEVHRLMEKDIPQYHEIQGEISILTDLLRNAKEDRRDDFEIKELEWELEEANCKRRFIDETIKDILSDERYVGHIYRVPIEGNDSDSYEEDSDGENRDGEDSDGHDRAENGIVPVAIEGLISEMSGFHIMDRG
jgi:hypothetical protein